MEKWLSSLQKFLHHTSNYTLHLHVSFLMYFISLVSLVFEPEECVQC
jgi:hypothetical protein